jgi:hypothetical protein
MKSKEKAIELVEKFRTHTYNGEDNQYSENAKRCALIAVDEIIEEVRDYCDTNFHQERFNFWQEVKSEIEKLINYNN